MKDQQEQHRQHRHHNHRENSHQSNRNNSFKRSNSKRFGQVFGLIYNIALIYFVADLAKSGNEKLALEIFAINAAVVIFAALLNKRSSKNRDDRRKNFRPRNDRNRSN